jgi:hypothetical protein
MAAFRRNRDKVELDLGRLENSLACADPRETRALLLQTI